MNLTPIQIASRNMFAALTDTSDLEAIELAFQDPVLSQLFEDSVNLAFTGPFGTVEHQCTAAEGARAALTAVLLILKGIHDTQLEVTADLEKFTDETQRGWIIGFEDVVETIEEIWRDLFNEEEPPVIDPEAAERSANQFATARQEADALEPDFEADEGSEALADLLSSLFGRPVTVLKVA